MPRNKKELTFSAKNLQAFADCERRFELGYLEELKWPAIETEPVLQSEQFLANGRRFHEMIHQDIVGISVVEPSYEEDEISKWWRNYLADNPITTEGERYPEKTLVSPLKGRLLVAMYDLFVVTEKGKVVIYDWKTWRKPQSLQRVQLHLQSRIYPLVLYEERASIAGCSGLQPEDIEMRYWYANFPDQSVSFHYSTEQYEADLAFLKGMIDRIDALGPGEFELTNDVTKCTFCPFRSYCERGDVAGRFDDFESIDDAEYGSDLGDLDDYESIAF